jgi:hypothetical protein
VYYSKNKEKMKKIVNKKVQTALLRGAVAISGGMCTIITSLFIEDIYGVLTTLFAGAGLICLINSCIKNPLK